MFDDIRDTAPHENIVDFDTLSEDLYYILVENTEGEAAVKVKSVLAGKGLMAYHKVYWWNVKTSGIALQDRSRKTMYPETITKIEKLMEGLEEWESNLKILDQHGSAYQLKAQAKLNALEVLMKGHTQVYESIERSVTSADPEEKYNELMSKLKEYAAKKRWESQHKKGNGDPMDIGRVITEVDQTYWSGPNGLMYESYDMGYFPPVEGDINYVKGGKKGGKGYKGGKTFGGKGPSLCTNCWQPGHHRSECKNPVVCNYCWKPGHMRSECNQLKEKGKGKAKGSYKGFSSKGKSKGYKGKGVYEVEQDYQDWNLSTRTLNMTTVHALACQLICAK